MVARSILALIHLYLLYFKKRNHYKKGGIMTSDKKIKRLMNYMHERCLSVDNTPSDFYHLRIIESLVSDSKELEQLKYLNLNEDQFEFDLS